jgi:hypothetical protein
MSLEQYYEKRKALYVQEAKDYALELYRKKGKIPRRKDFLNEFPLFLDRNEKLDLLDQIELGSTIRNFRKSKHMYASFADFLIDAGIPESAVLAQQKI